MRERRVGRGLAGGSHDSEIQDLHEVVLLAVPADEDVRRLDVAVTRPHDCGLRQRVTDLAKQVRGALGRDGPEATKQRVGVEAIEQFHHVIERAVGGDPEVEEVDGMGRAETGDDLGLAFESSDRILRTPAPFSRSWKGESA